MTSSNPQIRMLPFIFLFAVFYCSSILCGSTPHNNKCFEYERQALLQLKHGFDDLEHECGFLRTWGDHGDCCQWGGIRCDNITHHVTMLDLSKCGLQGKLSPSLVNLKHLRHLNLAFIDESQSQLLPSFLGSLANLEYLNLSGYIMGEVPHQLGNLSNLNTLDLTVFNDMDYPIYVKSLDWLSRLSLLRYLDLDGADLSKATNWMRIVSNLPSLSYLAMDHCHFPAKIPSSSPLAYINSSTTLRSISLSGNGFNDNSHNILEWLFSLPGVTTRLEHLDLSHNQLGGPIPDTLRHMHHLSYLDLSYNYLTNPVSSELTWSMPSLSYLSLSGNNFHGEFSDFFSDLCNLETLKLGSNYNFTGDLTYLLETSLGYAHEGLVILDLSQNSFFGTIPDSIGSFSSLRELYLRANQLTGQINPAIGRLSKLKNLDISSNSFQGSLTSELFLNLSNLQQFSSANNHGLIVDISADWVPPFQLDQLDLGSCNLGPGFPMWLRTQKKLYYIDISNAQISDAVPVSFWNSLPANVNYLNMSHNQIFGSIPNLPVMLSNTSVYTFDLGSNLFEGAVPSWFTNTDNLHLNDNRFSNFTDFLCHNTQKSLSKLDLSNNLLFGEIPDCWMHFDQLGTLNLQNNKFYGSIPMSFGSLKQLRYLHLYNNSLSGHLPASLQNCKSLIILNLRYNLLTGKIPPWIGNAFSELGALILQRNKFSGEIPSSLCRLSHLQILDFSDNNISGIIPKCIHNLTAMGENAEPTLGVDDYEDYIMLHYSEHSETENVPWKREEQQFGKSLSLLKSINLSYNELHGEIPDGVVSLTGLVSLDLSGNRLSGSIPSEIGDLTALDVLDLSDNHLSGEITASLTKVSNLGTLNLSNNNLTGEIPLGTQLQTRDASSYTGNPGLCGEPLPNCRRDHQAPGVSSITNGEDNGHDEYGVFPGLYISVLLGFIIGFWGVFGPLVVKRSWRHAYFRVLDRIHDKFCEIAIMIAAKTWKKPLN